MATGLQRPDVRAYQRAGAARWTGGGTIGNELLTAGTAVVLLGMLAALGLTILRMHTLLAEHMFIGIMLLGPVALKMGSTGYRFARYYLGDAEYRRKGPPLTALRLMAPIVVLSTIGVFATGIVLLLEGPSSRGGWLLLHKATFIVWIAFTAIHVLAHLPEMPRLLRSGYGRPGTMGRDVNGRAGRMMSLAGATVLGTVLAILLIPQFSPWLDSIRFLSGH